MRCRKMQTNLGLKSKKTSTCCLIDVAIQTENGPSWISIYAITNRGLQAIKRSLVLKSLWNSLRQSLSVAKGENSLSENWEYGNRVRG